MAWTTPRVSLLVALVAVTTLAAGVCAAERKDPTLKAAKSPSPASLFILRQQIDGEIGKTDPKAGLVVVNTPAGKLRVVSPALSDSTLTKGDAVLVEVGLLPARSTSQPTKASRNGNDGDRAILRERLQGQVAAVSTARGVLKLAMPAGAIDLWMPAALLERFKKDDSIPVEFALLPAQPGGRAEKAGLATLLLSIFGGKK